MSWGQRHDIAARRIANILHRYHIATSRTLEQKISDAGPNPQRVDPHFISDAKRWLLDQHRLTRTMRGTVEWLSLPSTPQSILTDRLRELGPVYDAAHATKFTLRMGQTLEIAVHRGLMEQAYLEHLGSFTDLDDHDDSTLYSKEDPPALSGKRPPGKKTLDFLVRHPAAGWAGIEVKNVRTWTYPHSPIMRDLLLKACALDVVPILIARRIHYSTFSTFHSAGLLLHQTFNQLYPYADESLADQASAKHLLGYHDIRVGNQPDARLKKFLHNNLPEILPAARESFNLTKHTLQAYAEGKLTYRQLLAALKPYSPSGEESVPGPD